MALAPNSFPICNWVCGTNGGAFRLNVNVRVPSRMKQAGFWQKCARECLYFMWRDLFCVCKCPYFPMWWSLIFFFYSENSKFSKYFFKRNVVPYYLLYEFKFTSIFFIDKTRSKPMGCFNFNTPPFFLGRLLLLEIFLLDNFHKSFYFAKGSVMKDFWKSIRLWVIKRMTFHGSSNRSNYVGHRACYAYYNK